MRELGTVIEQRMTDLDMNRQTFVRTVGISPAYLSELIRGTKLPSLIMLNDIACALDTTPARLLARAEWLEDAQTQARSPRRQPALAGNGR